MKFLWSLLVFYFTCDDGTKSQTLSVSEPDGSDVYCTDDATSCSMTVSGNCNSDMCLNTHYHCPTSNNCEYCEIDCTSTKICKLATLYSYSCDEVLVTTSSKQANVMEEMTIFGPKGGNLEVDIYSQQFSFYQSKIYSNETNNIDILITRYSSGDQIGSELFIDARDATGVLTMECATDCDSTTIICPQNEINSNCVLDCSSVLGNFKCNNLEVYTNYGLQSLDYACDSTSDLVCTGTNVYCFDDSSVACSMDYNSISDSWDCDGGDNTYCDGTGTTGGTTDTTTTTTDAPTDTNGNNDDSNETTNDDSTDDIIQTNGNGTVIGGNEDNVTSKNDGVSSWLVDNILLVCIITVIILLLILLCCCCRYLYRHDDKWLWLWDWCKIACCKTNDQKEIPGVLATAALSTQITQQERQHISPVPRHMRTDDGSRSTPEGNDVALVIGDQTSNSVELKYSYEEKLNK